MGDQINIDRLVIAGQVDRLEIPESREVRDRTEYLKDIRAVYEAAPWKERAHTLTLSTESGQTFPARQWLMDWVEAADRSWLLMLGAFGSGKTWLTRAFAHDMAHRICQGQSPAPIPISVSARALRDQSDLDLRALCLLATPRLADTLADSEARQRGVVLIVDGLDELASPIASDPTPYVHTLNRVASCLKWPQSRVILTCRGSSLQGNPGILRDALEPAVAQDHGDATEYAIESVLSRAGDRIDVVTIQPLDSNQVEEYLSRSSARDEWGYLRNRADLDAFSKNPFTLRLLEEALPTLVRRKESISLPVLYRVAIRALLARSAPTASATSIDRLIERLKQYSFGSVFGDTLELQEEDEMLLRSELLAIGSPSPLSFVHYSVFEYLLSTCVADEFERFDASILSRLNLVEMYSMNRFLVPLIGAFLRGHSSSVGSPTPVDTVSYSHFYEQTQWRANTGYGRHPSLRAADSTRPWSAMGSDELQLPPAAIPSAVGPKKTVAAISWYDAAQYARWRGCRLPSSAEMKSPLRAENTAGVFFWTSTWFDEEHAHLSVCNAQGEVVGGLNPDCRHPRVAICVV